MSDAAVPIEDQAKAVLIMNDRGGFTIPAKGLYPHQWLWDSCFIAIGLRHYNIERAQTELKSLLRGQWANGMLPHMIFAPGRWFNRDRSIWRGHISPHAPDNVDTSGMTQPPMLAEAVIQIGKKLTLVDRRTWYQTMYPGLLAYHEWLFADRDPRVEGLVVQIHPWETGMDDTPPWMHELHKHQLPLWVRLIDNLHISSLFNLFRRDLKYAKLEDRSDTVELLGLFATQRRLRRKLYNTGNILKHSIFSIEDLAFNCMFIRANQQLRAIAKTIKREIPETIKLRIKKSEEALELLWDAYTGQYYSRNFVTHKLIKVPNISTLLPLYSGAVTKERAAQLVNLMKDKKLFAAPYPVPSVPLNSDWFNPRRYWQGPTWINMNWMIIDGLKRYGYFDEAESLRKSSIALVEKAGCYEYFSPIDGSPAGSSNFSWTAALTIDLLK